MSGSISSVSYSPYHSPIQKYEIEKNDSVYDLSLVYSKYLNLFRLPFRIVSTTFGWVKLLPIGSDARAIIAVQDKFIRSFTSTLTIHKFIISQIGFYNSISKLNKKLYQEDLGKLSQQVTDVFFSTLSFSLSYIKILQLFDKYNWVRLIKISPQLPVLFAKSSNLFTVLLVGRGLVNNVVLLTAQVQADYASPTWSKDGLSPKTRKSITSVASKSLSLFYILTTTASLHFGIYTNPILLMGVSTATLLLNFSNNIDTYQKMLWEPTPAAIADRTSFLPA